MGGQLFFERFVWFDREVRAERYPNATVLADHFELSTKTAHRSIEYFRDRLVAPLVYDPVRKGYRYTDPSFQLPIVRLTDDEVLALLISRKLITEASAGSLAEELGAISNRLGVLLSEHLPGKRHPEDAFSFRWRSVSPTDPLVFQNCATALLQNRLLTFCYYSPVTASCTMRTVEPHHLVNYLGTWHLIAYCHLRNAWRDFVLGRISICTAENDLFEMRPDSEWQPYLSDTFGIFQNRKPFTVVIRFSPTQSRWMRGVVLHPAQEEQLEEDGSLTVSFTASHEVEVLQELLQHGAQAELIAPDWLRVKLVDELTRTIRQYHCVK